VPSTAASWRPSRWSLTRKLPLVTAATVVVLVAINLTATYRALVQARSEALHERLANVARQLARSTEQGNRDRAAVLRRIAADSALVALVRAGLPVTSPDTASAVMRALARVRLVPDSLLPVQLWSADGRLLAQLGQEAPGGSLASVGRDLAPSGNPPRPSPPLQLSTDSVQVGALYPAAGGVYYWTVVPVIDRGRRIGAIAQQRRIGNSPQALATVRELIGSNIAVAVRNATDSFTTSLAGVPLPAPLARDTLRGGYVARRATGLQLGAEARVAGTPFILTFEAPARSILAEPRATLRRLIVLGLVITVVGVLVSWLLSRRITRPLTALTTAAEAIALGDYAQRVQGRRADGDGDEVERLGASFNRMANEIETAQRELAAQVVEAHTASEALHRVSLEAVEARDAAEHANQAKSDFLAVMSHELRTPLNAIGGYAEILQLGVYGAVTEQQRDALTRIARSQQTLLSLINDILNFAKLEAGEVQYAMQDVSLATVIEALDAMIAPQIAARQLTLHVLGSRECPLVRADPDKLQQVLLNLLSNAIKFTPEGGTITVECTTHGDRVAVAVRDTGIGIAADRLASIFDPFIQVGRALNRPHEGVGLGLSISRDLATGMHGSLTVTSVSGEGSSFTLELTRAR
jgi:signal transduction histidine kinase